MGDDPESRLIIYLTAGEVFMFNREILRRAGQEAALLRERGLLESAVQRLKLPLSMRALI